MSSKAMSEDFKNKFFNLSGTSLNEKKISLNCLLNQSCELFENEIILRNVAEDIEKSIQTHLHKILFLHFLIHFREYHTLKHLLLECNDLVFNKLKKEKWFFEKFFQDNKNCYIESIVPQLSYNFNRKLLQKLILNEEQADELFEALLIHYGLQFALKILTSCTSKKIENTLKQYPIQLSPKELEKLYDKNPNLIVIYLQQDAVKNVTIFEYIALKNPADLKQLCEKFKFEAVLGRNATKKFLQAFKDDILTKPEIYIKHLNGNVLVKSLGTDFEVLFLNLFPLKIADCPNSQCARLLKYYPKTKQYDLIIRTYNQIFAKKLEERPNLIDTFILKLIPDATERERLAKIQPNSEEIQYYTPETCFKIVLEKINFARYPHERAILLGKLTECCIINNDTSALLDVAKFCNKRFKNDNEAVHQKVLITLCWNKFDYGSLRAEHWLEIRKMLARGPAIYNLESWYKYFEYLLRIKSPDLEKELVAFFKETQFSFHHLGYIDPKNRKPLIAVLFDITSGVLDDDVFQCELLAACRKYGYKNFDPSVIKSLEKVILDGNFRTKESQGLAWEVAICNSCEELESLRKLFFENLQLATPVNLKWFLIHRPDLIELKFDQILNLCGKDEEFTKCKPIWRLMKYYNYLYKNNVLDTNLTPLKCTVLSHIASDDFYIRTLESNFDNFNITNPLLMGIKNRPHLEKYLNLILTNSEYVSSLFYKIPIHKMLTILNQLKSIDSISKIYSQQISLEKVADYDGSRSVRTSFKYFLNFPSDKTWSIFVEKLKKTEKIDAKLISHSKKVPFGYRSSFYKHLILKTENDPKITEMLLKQMSTETLLSEDLYEIVMQQKSTGEEYNIIISDYLIKFNKRPDLDLTSVLETFFQIYMLKENVINVELIDFLLSKCNSIEVLPQSILLHFAKLKNQTIESLAVSISDLHLNLVQEYDELITEIFFNILKLNLTYFCKNNVEFYKFLWLLLNHNKSTPNILLVLKLLPLDSEPEDKESWGYFEMVLNEIGTSNLDSIQMHFHLYFKHLEIQRKLSYYNRTENGWLDTSWLSFGARPRIGSMYY